MIFHLEDCFQNETKMVWIRDGIGFRSWTFLNQSDPDIPWEGRVYNLDSNHLEIN